MTSQRQLFVLIATLSALTTALVGCATGTTGVTASDADLMARETITDVYLDGEPPEPVAEHVAEEAPAGCEGRLANVASIGLAVESGLLVAFDAAGAPLCADTAVAVETELSEITTRVDAAGRSAIENSRASGCRRGFERHIYAGDPNPQPNVPQFFGI